MTRAVWRFGLISGAIMAATMLLTTVFMDDIGFDRGAVVGYTAMLVAFIMVYFGIRSYRDTVMRGSIKFWRAVQVGALISLISSVCYVATWEFVYFRMMPNFGERYAAYAVEKAKKSGATPEQQEKQRKELVQFYEQYKNPLFNAAVTFVEPFPLGLVVTLVSAGILSRRRRENGVTLPT